MLAIARRVGRWRRYPRRMWLMDAVDALLNELPEGWYVATDGIHGPGRPNLSTDTKAVRCGTWGRRWWRRTGGVDLYAWTYRRAGVARRDATPP